MGAEQVSNSARTISQAADQIQRAANTMAEALDRHRRVLEVYIQRIDAALGPADEGDRGYQASP